MSMKQQNKKPEQIDLVKLNTYVGYQSNDLIVSLRKMEAKVLMLSHKNIANRQTDCFINRKLVIDRTKGIFEIHDDIYKMP